MTRPRVLAAIVAWLLVVAGVSTLVWVVISRAGNELVAPQQPLVATAGSGGQTPSASSSPATSPARPSTVERRTWEGTGGMIIAACDGRAVRLVSAQPLDGFHADLKNDGPEELEVEFEGREDQSGSDVTVVGRCVSGVPEFVSQVDDG